ncbi:MAG TPA: histidine phosphatase family protein [Candidatus Kaiserbacteria bacterium]|nr:histidine phosphatase family protein [Candidatus Kaiserbacteria bacterium]
MAVKHFYFVRHGETADNRALVHQSINVPLNECGKKQAEAAASALSCIRIDSILTSDAERTKETANAIASKVNTKAVAEPLLREMHRGVLVEGEHHFSLRSMKAGVLMFLLAGNGSWHFGNGENVSEFRKRLVKMRTLFSEMSGTHNVIVTHRGVINGLCFDIVHNFFGSSYAFLLAVVLIKTKNGSITELTYDPERTTPWVIVRANDTRHLNDISCER